MRSEALGTTALYRIGELADKANVSRRTVDFYTREGLLEPIERTEGNFRLYSEDCLNTLATIKMLQEHHWSLEEIKQYLTAKRDYAEVLQTVNDHLREVEKGLLQLQSFPDRELSMDCERMRRNVSLRVLNVMDTLRLHLASR